MLCFVLNLFNTLSSTFLCKIVYLEINTGICIRKCCLLHNVKKHAIHLWCHFNLCNWNENYWMQHYYNVDMVKYNPPYTNFIFIIVITIIYIIILKLCYNWRLREWIPIKQNLSYSEKQYPVNLKLKSLTRIPSY